MTALTEASTSNFTTLSIADVGECKIHYHDAGQGPVVAMMHGGGPGAGGRSNFYRNIDAFVAAGFRVILIDFPGFNKSEVVLPKIGRGLMNARALKGLLDKLGIQKAHLIGNSMGGASALSFALNFPETLDRLVLLGPAGIGPSLVQPNPQEGVKLMYKLYQEPTPENFERMMNAFVYNPAQLDAELRKGRWENIERNPQHLKNFITGNNNWDIAHRLGEVKHRTLVTWGRDDRFVPIDNAWKLITHMPDARLYVFPNCGHWVQWEHAAEFNTLVTNFLNT